MVACSAPVTPDRALLGTCDRVRRADGDRVKARQGGGLERPPCEAGRHARRRGAAGGPGAGPRQLAAGAERLRVLRAARRNFTFHSPAGRWPAWRPGSAARRARSSRSTRSTAASRTPATLAAGGQPDGGRPGPGAGGCGDLQDPHDRTLRARGRTKLGRDQAGVRRVARRAGAPPRGRARRRRHPVAAARVPGRRCRAQPAQSRWFVPRWRVPAPRRWRELGVAVLPDRGPGPLPHRRDDPSRRVGVGPTGTQRGTQRPHRPRHRPGDRHGPS